MESLLSITQGLIERTYGTVTGVDDISRFVIGDRGYRRLATRHSIVRGVEEPGQGGVAEPGSDPLPQVLIRSLDRGAALAVYFPDEMIARLERHPPTQTLHAGNVDDFAAFVEEIDHFLVIAHGLSQDREITLLELEIRANISKELVLKHFIGRLSGQVRLDPAQRQWVRFHLFEKHCYIEDDDRVRSRYEEARRHAVRILDRLAELPAPARVRALRRWNALPAPLKMRQGLDGLV